MDFLFDDEFLYLWVGAILLVFAAIAFVAAISDSDKKKSQQADQIKENRHNLIYEIERNACAWIGIAESFFATAHKAGERKKACVLSQIQEVCKAHGIYYDETYWEDFINKTVDKMNRSVAK